MAVAVGISTIDFGFSAPSFFIVYSLTNAIFSFIGSYHPTYKVFLGLMFGIGFVMLISRIFFTGATSPVKD